MDVMFLYASLLKHILFSTHWPTHSLSSSH